MKSIYQYFVDYYDSIKSPNSNSALVYEGIRAYLESRYIDPDDPADAEPQFGENELYRFRLMPPQTFQTYFEYYELRDRIITIEMETGLLALNRAVEGKTITESVYQNKINQFFALSADLAGDKRYSSWIRERSAAISENLKYAIGATDEVPVATQTRIYLNESEESI